MEILKGPMVLSTHRPWFARFVEEVVDRWHAWRCRAERRSTLKPIRLEDLDARALSDLGLDRSETSSVRAEARDEAELTRLRIAALGGHRA